MSEKKDDNTGAWWSSIIALVVALVVGAIAVYSAWKQGRETAKLLHEHDVEQENKRQAILDSALAETEEEMHAALDRASEHLQKVHEIRARIATVDAERQKQLRKIDEVTSSTQFRFKRGNATANSDSDNPDTSASDQQG